MPNPPLYLIRHPRPAIAQGICYGQLDVPVNETECQAALIALRPQLQALGDIQLVSSPLQRCRDLADAITLALGLPPPKTDARLQEIAFGQWEGVAWDAIPRHELDAWAADIGGYIPPQGKSATESVRQLQQRVLSWLEDYAHTERPTVVVTHAGVIRVLLGFVHALPIEQWSVLPIDYASLTVLSPEGKIAAYA